MDLLKCRGCGEYVEPDEVVAVPVDFSMVEPPEDQCPHCGSEDMRGGHRSCDFCGGIMSTAERLRIDTKEHGCFECLEELSPQANVEDRHKKAWML